ncbi:hypothetical protein FE257_011714 [Aspergillus nanangensis]|uniref:Ketoreductase domain-containing protein n=1 Tax=Aspergillus nanangensis TaxID=2582783 RepID=A0AAD4CV48_ASPNN|nr:hypothetical protein FE257_011714 [Aspergillus nanangensis]
MDDVLGRLLVDGELGSSYVTEILPNIRKGDSLYNGQGDSTGMLVAFKATPDHLAVQPLPPGYQVVLSSATVSQFLPISLVYDVAITSAGLLGYHGVVMPQRRKKHLIVNLLKLLELILAVGGTSGIGFAIAERFLQEGATRVILVGRSYERLANTAAKLGSSPVPHLTTTPSQGNMVEASAKLSLLVGDVSDASSWLRNLEKAMQPVDILVNAAGISISSILPKTEPEDIARILRTNLEGAVLTSRAFLRAAIRSRMKNRGTDPDTHAPSKCIINISSLLALKGGTGAVPYAASKAGLLGLTRSMTVEAASSLRDVLIRSNAIVPGYIETPMISDFSEGENGRLRYSIPLRRFGKPHEVADAAVFLAHNEYANNCILNLDGGLSAV